jgi:ring-1,2-phenylacetyl-CoA epoxidase subunit PaaE
VTATVDPRVVTRRGPAFHPLPVAAVTPLTDDSVVVTFAVPDELREDYRFTAGQHLTLRAPGEGRDERRNYSICSSPDSGLLQVAVKRLEGGTFSAYVHDELRPGDVLDVMTPTGHFFADLDPAAERHHVAIAAGSGITPVLSLLTTTLQVEPRSRFTLVYGNRTTASVMFLEELADLKDRYPDRFHLVHVLSREPQEVALFTGRIDTDRLESMLATIMPVESVDEWYLCGPFALVEAARAVLSAHGVDPHHVHFELFFVESEPPRRRERPPSVAGADAGDPTSNVTVMLDGRTTTLALANDDEAILDALLRVRADAPYACKGGVCGTCRARLVEGTVEMDRSYALEESEREAGVVLTCQSHPTSAHVVLDYDR